MLVLSIRLINRYFKSTNPFFFLSYYHENILSNVQGVNIATGCPIILAGSVHLSYNSGSDNDYGTPGRVKNNYKCRYDGSKDGRIYRARGKSPL